MIYANEREVGQAIAESGLPREEFFITSKGWLDHYGYEKARQSVLDSLEKMGLEPDRTWLPVTCSVSGSVQKTHFCDLPLL